jgi:hypothetical protein
MPLGKISYSQLSAAYSLLAEAHEYMESPISSYSTVLRMTNQFFSLVPTQFDISKPPMLDNLAFIQASQWYYNKHTKNYYYYYYWILTLSICLILKWTNRESVFVLFLYLGENRGDGENDGYGIQIQIPPVPQNSGCSIQIPQVWHCLYGPKIRDLDDPEQILEEYTWTHALPL